MAGSHRRGLGAEEAPRFENALGRALASAGQSLYKASAERDADESYSHAYVMWGAPTVEFAGNAVHERVA